MAKKIEPQNIYEWLLEDKNPAVKYRTKVELLGEPADDADIAAAKEWVLAKLPENWQDTRGLWYGYYVTALAECGLKYQDFPIEVFDKAFQGWEEKFNCGCADFMLMTALMKLGFAEHPTMQRIINTFSEDSLPDGGFLCLHRAAKFDYTPKSCYKANLHVLLFVAECHKAGITVPAEKTLVEYFMKRNLFYRSDDPTALVLPFPEGWRVTDTFHPFEPMRMGIHNVLEAFSALGYGNDERLKEAWACLNRYADETGKVGMTATLTKSYLPKERAGKPSKWVTFYKLLAEKHCHNTEKLPL